MKKSFLILLAIFMLAVCASAQNVLWKDNFGGEEKDNFNQVIETSDGGYIVVGSTNSNVLSSMQITAANDGLFAKSVNYKADGASSSETDAVIVKYNKQGEIEWMKKFGGAADDSFTSVAEVNDTNGGFVAVGYSYFGSFGNGDWTGVTSNDKSSEYCDSIIVKYDKNGKVVWKNHFGGLYKDFFEKVVSADGGFVAVGNSDFGSDSVGGGDLNWLIPRGGIDAMVVKFDADGELYWANNFGGYDNDYFTSLISVNDGYVVVGYSYKLSFLNGSWINIVSRDVDYFCDGALVKIKLNGGVSWRKNFGGNGYDYFYDVANTTDGGFVIVGSAYSFGTGDWSDVTGNGQYDATILKYDYIGNFEGKSRFGGVDDDSFYSVTETADTNSIVAVGYSDKSSFNTGDWAGISSKGSDDAIFVKYNGVGSVDIKNNFGGNSNDYSNSVAIANSNGTGGLIIAGSSGLSSFGTYDWLSASPKGLDDATVVRFENTNETAAADYGITLNKATLSLNLNEVETLVSSVTPSDATNQMVTWSSSDERVVKVDKYGRVTPVAPNYIDLNNNIVPVYIIATLVANGNKTAKCSVIVNNAWTIFVNSLTLNKEKMYLDKGTTTDSLKASILPSTATHKTLKWTSDDESVATVDSNGRITAVENGVANITATTIDGSNLSASCEVTVVTPVLTMSIKDTAGNIVTPKTIKVNESFTLVADVGPTTASIKDVLWTSSDPRVVSVDTTGVITGISNGTVTITATSVTNPAVKATCEITVVTPVISVDLNRNTLALNRGSEYSLVAIINPDTASNKDVEWVSDNPGVATVSDNGLVTAKSTNGTATITVRTKDGNKTADCEVTVADLVKNVTIKDPINKLQISKLTLTIDDTKQLTANVQPVTADQGVIWTSSNTKSVTVDENGLLTAVDYGTSTITVTTKEGGYTDTCIVDVKDPVTSIALDITTLNMNVGDVKILKPTVIPVTANQNVTWESSAPAIASVDKNGEVVALSNGDAVITVASEDGTEKAECKVKVTTATIGLTIDQGAVSLSKNGANNTQLLVAKVYPSEADQTVKWTSNNTDVVTVDNVITPGLITAVGEGVAVITATTKDGKYSDTCVVTVTIVAKTLELSATTLNLKAGQSGVLVATLTPSDVTNADIDWASSDESIVSVDSVGNVYAVDEGKATITATTTDGTNLKATCDINVKSTITGLSLNASEQYLQPTDTFQLVATITPEVKKEFIKWESSDTSIATVDDNGLVTAKANGEATIKVSTTDGSDLSDTCLIKVGTPVIGISLDKTDLTLNVNSSYNLIATINPSDASYKGVTWQTSNEEIATVDQNGKVTAKANGSVMILVVTDDGAKTASCNITVVTPVTSVSLDKTDLTINAGSSDVLTAIVNPDTATNQSVVWSSSDDSIATVDQNGKIIAIKGGIITITVTTVDGGKTATCKVKVYDPYPITNVVIAPSSIIIKRGETYKLNAVITPTNALNKNVTWKSFNENICTISDSGLVTGVQIGTTLVKVTTMNGKSANCMVTVRK